MRTLFLNKFDEIKFDMNLSEIVIGMSKFYDPVLWFEKEGKFSNLQATLNGEKDYHKISLQNEANKGKKFF